MTTKLPIAKTFQDLVVWQKAHQFVLGVYKFTMAFPNNEMYGLTSQLRRAAVSIPANIAEGLRKRGKPDKARFFNIAQGSVDECKYYLLLSKDLEYGHKPELGSTLEEVSKMLNALHKSFLNSDN